MPTASSVKKLQPTFNHGEEDDLLQGLQKALEDSTPVAIDKCEWFRSQIIGNHLEFHTPFGNRLLTYADNTASGRSLMFIENFILQNVLPFYGNTHTDDSFVGAKTSKMVREAALFVKNYLGGKEEDVLLFCGSGCTGALKRLQEVTGLAVPSTVRNRLLQTMKEEERWVVYTGPFEHHSNLLSWRQSLAQVVEIPVNKQGLLDMTILKTALESPQYATRPKMGAFSACSNVSGYMIDTRAISRLLHKHGAFACFDFAASAPHMKLDMRSGELDGYDAIVLSPHKFMGGPGSSGILLMSRTLYLLKNHPPSTCGGGTVRWVNCFSEKDTLYCEDTEEREDAGTPPIIQKIRCALSFWVNQHMGFDLIKKRERRFIKTAMKRLSEHRNIKILGNTEVKRASILSFLVQTRIEKATNMPCKVKPLHGRFITKLLNDLFGIQARGGCACAGPYGHFLLKIDRSQSLAIREAIDKGYDGVKPGWARVSFPYYISEEDFDYILSSIEFVGTFGQRFLALYNMDWKTGDWTFRDEAQIYYSSNTLNINNVQEIYNCHPVDMGASPLQQKYSFYLRAARAIAESLPESPEERCIPKDIDPQLILFRV